MGDYPNSLHRTNQGFTPYKMFFSRATLMIGILAGVHNVHSAPQQGYGGWGYNPGTGNGGSNRYFVQNDVYGNTIYSDGQDGHNNLGGNREGRPDYNNGNDGFYVNDNAFGNSIYSNGQGGHNNFGGNSGVRPDYNDGNGNNGFYINDDAYGNSIYNDGHGGHNNFGANGNSGSRPDYNRSQRSSRRQDIFRTNHSRRS